MAFSNTNFLNLTGQPPGRNTYRYDINGTVDDVDDVEAAGYFNNVDDDLNLAIGDRIDVFEWNGAPFASGQVLQNAIQLVVTNVISRTAASSAGNVDLAQVFLTTSLFSSGT